MNSILARTVTKQLIVWNPEAEEIIGGYRYLLGTDWEYDDKGQPILATSHMFHFSEKFLKEYAPLTIELGRSLVSLPYQSSRMGAKSLFALDNLWDGLGALTVIKPNVKYFFGKMTMYPSYIRKGRDMILYFLKTYFDDKEKLIIPMKPLELDTDPAELEKLFTGHSFKEDYRILNGEIRKLGYNISPVGECLYESFAYDEALWHSHQLRLWRCGGNGYSHCYRGDLRGEARAPYRFLHQGAPPRPLKTHQRSQQSHLQRTLISILFYPI